MTPFVIEHGDPTDPLMLCLHGIGSCANAFDGQAPLAARLGRHIVAWDAPGYRNSPDPDVAFALDDWADAAAGLIRIHAGGDGRADVLGVSWGGVMATRLVLRHPELVRSLILADSSVGSGTSPRRAEAMRARADDVSVNGLEAFARSRAPYLLTPEASQALIDTAAQMMIDSVRRPPYDWACASMADTDHTASLGDIGAPTLVIVGELDTITPPSLSTALCEGIPNARLVTIPDAGHLANQQEPKIFNDAVAAFLS